MGLFDDFQALLVAFCGGMVAALYKFSQERKVEGSNYDVIDFILLSITGSFAGVMGYCVARWQLEDPFIVIAFTGVASTGGYAVLIFLKDSFLAAARAKLGVTGSVRLPEAMYREIGPELGRVAYRPPESQRAPYPSDYADYQPGVTPDRRQGPADRRQR